jgi:hypothetical protein
MSYAIHTRSVKRFLTLPFLLVHVILIKIFCNWQPDLPVSFKMQILLIKFFATQRLSQRRKSRQPLHRARQNRWKQRRGGYILSTTEQLWNENLP